MQIRLLRLIDILAALIGLICSAPILLVIMSFGFFDTGAPVFRQQRVGRHGKIFTLIKFRTMVLDTESIETHLASAKDVTLFGQFLRKNKLDELPQLWNVLKGEMSIVGPRPGLPQQKALIKARCRLNVYSVRPGITGFAQISGIDMSTPELLAEFDAKMIAELTVRTYFKYIYYTLIGRGRGDPIN